MKQLVFPFAAVLSFMALFSSCKEIIAKNISSDVPVLIVPSVNDTVQFNPVQFKWEEVDGAQSLPEQHSMQHSTLPDMN